VTLSEACTILVGDLSRFGAFEDRVHGLIDVQVAEFRSNSSDWLIVPWRNHFYLFSQDNEGQRRGREMVTAFLGPVVVLMESVPSDHLVSQLPLEWKEERLLYASRLMKVIEGDKGAQMFVDRLEDMISVVSNKRQPMLQIEPTFADLIRDFRLSLLALDDGLARSLLQKLELDGTLSPENIRYLGIEYHASFARWAELAASPYIETMMSARRPRAISESLLRMIYHTQLTDFDWPSREQAFSGNHVLDNFGPYLSAIRVPSTREGRFVCFLAALAEEDLERQEAILEYVTDPNEMATLKKLDPKLLIDELPSAVNVLPGSEPKDPVVELFEAGRYQEVIDIFLDGKSQDHADLAVQSVLDSGSTEKASLVLGLVRQIYGNLQARLDRRTENDLAELQKLVDGTCGSWVEWGNRIAGQGRWAEAAQIARDNSSSWIPVSSLDSDSFDPFSASILEAHSGHNADQLIQTLDLLCQEASVCLRTGVNRDFCDVILVIFSEQENFSGSVQSAYLTLASEWLESGAMTDRQYGDVLDQAGVIWKKIAAPNSYSWVVNLLDALMMNPCRSDTARQSFVVNVIRTLRGYDTRLTHRERVEVESLAQEVGIPIQEFQEQQDEIDMWSTLDEKIIGIYSLLPKAAMHLKNRLAKLCSPKAVDGNEDKVDTKSLRALATRSDYFIVDTWHAAHKATECIDEVLPKTRQILPKQRGVTGFLKALEDALLD
jgi:hypothetical protein